MRLGEDKSYRGTRREGVQKKLTNGGEEASKRGPRERVPGEEAVRKILPH